MLLRGREHMLSMQEAPGLTFSTNKKIKRKEEKEKKERDRKRGSECKSSRLNWNRELASE